MSTAPTDFDSLSKRAAGRYRYNRARQYQALLRLSQLVKLIADTGFQYGYQSLIAEHLGVSRSTICRDIARLSRVFWGGREADEAHRAEIRSERRIRTEDKAEMERNVQDPSTLKPVEDPRTPNPPDQSPVPLPVAQLPRRLPSLGSDLGSRLRPEKARSRHRRGA